MITSRLRWGRLESYFKNFSNFSPVVVVIDIEPRGHIGQVHVEVEEPIQTLPATVDRPRVSGQDVADGTSQRRDVAEVQKFSAARFELSQIFFGSGRENNFEIGLLLDPTCDPNFLGFVLCSCLTWCFANVCWPEIGSYSCSWLISNHAVPKAIIQGGVNNT